MAPDVGAAEVEASVFVPDVLVFVVDFAASSETAARVVTLAPAPSTVILRM